MAQMKFLGGLFVAIFLLVPLTSAKSTGFSYCNKKTDYAVKVSGLEINPYPISRSKNTSFEISATTSEAISDGKLVIGVSYFGWHIHDEDHDLCKETSCPVSVGDFVVSHSQVLPGITPPPIVTFETNRYMQGSYSLKMTMEDGKKKQLTCITFDFSIGFIAEENLADM